MATIEQKIQAEERIRRIITEQGLPEPDQIEYGHTCVRVLWLEHKLCVRIDIDEDPDYDYDRQRYKDEEDATSAAP